MFAEILKIKFGRRDKEEKHNSGDANRIQKRQVDDG